MYTCLLAARTHLYSSRAQSLASQSNFVSSFLQTPDVVHHSLPVLSPVATTRHIRSPPTCCCCCCEDMQPHHEAAEMSHATTPTVDPPKYSNDKKVDLEKCTSYYTIDVKECDGIEDTDTAATKQQELGPFDQFYKYFLMASAAVSFLLFFNLISASPTSQDWVTANVLLAFKAFVLIAFHTVAGGRRYVVGRVKGMAPWYCEAMYVVFHFACCGLHFWCAANGGAMVSNLISNDVWEVSILSMGA